MFALSFTTVLMLASGFGTEELVAREVARDRSRLDNYLSNAIAVKLLTSIALLAFAAAFVNIAGYSADVRVAVYLIGAGVMVENLGRTWHSVLQAYERMELVSISLILQRVLTAGAGIAVLLAGGGLLEVSLVFLGGSLVGFLTAAWVLRRFVVRPRLALDRSRWWPLIKAGAPIGVATLLLTVLVKVDQVLISFLSGGDNREVGFYAAAFRLVEATMFISWAFTAAFLPWASRHEAGDITRLARGYELGNKALAAVLLPVGIAFAVLAEPLIDLFYGDAFAAAVGALRWLGIMTVFYGLNLLAATVLVARDRPMDFARICAVVVVLNVVLNLVLIPPLGATGAALAAAVSSIVLAGLGIWRIRGLTGHLRLLRTFLGPLVAGAAMAGAMLLTGLPLVLALMLGGLVYVGVLAVFEVRAFPDDVALLRDLVRRRGDGGPKPPEPSIPAMEAS